ncbi:hypothetical protein [Frisingicoccus caecimuris]|uniref:hypothetical protein n=1 Tax=Frisingicoccus caecimuris TaxID=1796636 RepID=UPI002FE599A4
MISNPISPTWIAIRKLPKDSPAHSKAISLNIECPAKLSEQIPKDKREALFALLSQDPRPSYQNDAERIYRLRFAGMEIEFRVKNETAYIISIWKNI